MRPANSNIALICFPVEQQLPDWPGEKRIMPTQLFHAAAMVQAWLSQTEAEYVLFWDCKLGQPSYETCQKLLKKPGEVWHLGLQSGLSGRPKTLDFILPTWLLQLDAPATIDSDCWRLSLGACLVKTQVIRKAGIFQSNFSSLEAAGLEWGYRMFRTGALLRNAPELLPLGSQPTATTTIELKDELSFIALHFSRKWYWWCIFRLFATGTSWSSLIEGIRGSYAKTKLPVPPMERPLEPERQGFKAVDWQGKVSILMPTLNRYPYALNSIEQLMQQTVQPGEILITDQSDASVRWDNFAKDYPLVRVFPQTEKGQCLAWNKLLEESTCPYVLFLGDDADGIRPDFVESMCSALEYYQADMVASHVVEIGGAADPYQERMVKMAEGFPITLINKELVLRAGGMDMAFNKGIRADQDLAIRCRNLGAHMVFDSHIRILHHRAPVGGLRWHGQRVLTNHISKISPFKIRYPAESEYYLFQKHFSKAQRREHGYILMLSQMLLQGPFFKKALRLLYFCLIFPRIWSRYARLWQ